MKKKQVSLDVFEESVLPALQQKHVEIAELQKTINEEYAIYEEDGEGKRTIVKFTVSGPATKGKTAEELERESEERIAAEVKRQVEAITKANPGAKKILDPSGGEGGGNGAGDVKIPAEVKRYGPIKHFANRKIAGLDQDQRAYAFGMWAMATMGGAKQLEWCREHGILVTKLQSENVNASGGFLVPEQFSSDLIELKEMYGVARRVFRSEPMTSDTKLIPRRTGGLTAAFVGEGAAGTESTTSWDQVRLTAKDIMVLTRMTAQVNADSIINWSDRLAYECAYATTLLEDQCAFVGTGSAAYGGISGVVTRLSAVWSTGTAGVGYGLVKQGTSTTWSAIVLGDFHNVVGSLPQYADTPSAVWIMHRAFYYGIVEKLVLASGGVPAYEVREGRRARPLFLGYPVEISQVMPGVTASAQVSALLGDFTAGAAFGDRQQDQISFSDQASVGGQSMWERNELGVRCVSRMDINVHDVGNGTASTGVGPIVGLITG